MPEWITFIEDDGVLVNYIMLRSNNILHKGEWTLRIIATLEDVDGVQIDGVVAYGTITVHVGESAPPVSVSR